MSEYGIGVLGTAGIITVVIASMFYWLGGRSKKWLRRFISPAILTIGLCGISLIKGNFSPWFLGVYPCLVLGFSLGYGADNMAEKVLKRALYALGVLSAGVMACLGLGGGAWWLLAVQLILAVGSVILGVKSILPAAVEEGIICILLTLFIPLYPLIQGG